MVVIPCAATDDLPVDPLPFRLTINNWSNENILFLFKAGKVERHTLLLWWDTTTLNDTTGSKLMMSRFLVFFKHPIIGIIIEFIGFVGLFGSFFPVILQALRQTPFIGHILSLPYIRGLVSDKVQFEQWQLTKADRRSEACKVLAYRKRMHFIREKKERNFEMLRFLAGTNMAM
nr:hypothetical protein L203_00160 [Cryptococcus depauperatus CBS 7841]